MIFPILSIGRKPPPEINVILKLSELNNRTPDKLNKLKITILSIEYMINNRVKEFIEIGPGKVLSGLVKRINDKVLSKNLNTLEEIQNLK